MFNETFKKKEKIAPGTYAVKLKSITEYKPSNPQYSESWIFNFDFVAPANVVGKACPGMFVPKGLVEGNKLDRAIRALLGRPLTSGEQLNEQMLIGKVVEATLVYEPKNKKDTSPENYVNKIKEIFCAGTFGIVPQQNNNVNVQQNQPMQNSTEQPTFTQQPQQPRNLSAEF